MTIEDQLRAAGRAVTEQIQELPRLTLPAASQGAGSGARRHRFPRPTGPARSRWLIPLTAAAAVIAVAGTLVATRTLHASAGAHPAASSPASQGDSAVGSPNAIPRYFVSLPRDNAGNAQTADVADSRTGKLLATVRVPGDGSFAYVAAGGDDRTFVLADALQPDSLSPVGSKPAWAGTFDLYQLRVMPGRAHPAQLTKLPIGTVNGAVTGIAVSPDDRECAVESVTTAGLTVRVYALPSGSVLGTWTMSGAAGTLIGAWGVSWLTGGRSVAVTTPVGPINFREDSMEVRTLNVNQPSGGLLADSRLDVRFPYLTQMVCRGRVLCEPAAWACNQALVTPDGGSLLCGLYGVPLDPLVRNCGLMGPVLFTYSMPAGKITRILYRNTSVCAPGTAVAPLWANSSGHDVIALVASPVTNYKENIGLFVNGRVTWTSYPFLPTNYAGTGAIAF